MFGKIPIYELEWWCSTIECKIQELGDIVEYLVARLMNVGEKNTQDQIENQDLD